ncbi:MAG: GCN5-related N-acetyltransferase [Bryobacterales bacterium]|nr:GCN5-related N-acetyltransferase [Bryobacterales bacterium]
MPELVDLRQVDLQQLEPLLAEETAEWEKALDWDFSRNAAQIRRFAGPRALPGVALLDGGEVAGYGYTVLEHPKGLIGDVYLRPGWRGLESEVRLFKVLLDALTGTEGIERIESQLMLLPPQDVRALSGSRFVQLFERRLLSRQLSQPIAGGPTDLDPRYRVEEWHASAMDSLPRLIVRAYAGQIDAEINDQFTTEWGASSFLRALLENAGCGQFSRGASFVAVDRHTEWLAGVILTSLVAPDTAHITQICVMPEAQGSGLGRELLRRCLVALEAAGVQRVTLTVTATNTRANRIYDTAGFAELRRFCAIVWNSTPRMSNSVQGVTQGS